ncbi:Pleckstrin-like, plant [Sesbania bispinosa]|nr:Pleckstrin-like, plant [Sesbania bispinosa]
MEPKCTINCRRAGVSSNRRHTSAGESSMPMEFLSRSWSASALEVSKALAPQPQPQPPLPSCMPSKPVNGSVAITSGRLSHSSEPLNGGGSLAGTDSPPISPSDEFDDVVKFFRANNSIHPLFNGGRASAATGNGMACSGPKMAAVASSIAAIAAATAASSTPNKDGKMAKTDMAIASAATLVAAQCVEAAEAMGAERDHLASVVSSAVNVRSHDDITTLTAAAATENFLGTCSQELLAKGSELLKRTRKGDLHWKIVSVYIHRTGQVMLKMKSRHVAGTITKKKKNVVFDICTDLPAWPGRHLLEDGEKRRYFGLKTESRGMVEFECRNQREYDIWTQGVSRLLSIVAQKRQNRYDN